MLRLHGLFKIIRIYSCIKSIQSIIKKYQIKCCKMKCYFELFTFQ